MRNVTILLAVVAVMAMAAPAWGGFSLYWVPTGTDTWDLGSNWTGGIGNVPTGGDDAIVDNGGTCEIRSGTTAVAWAVYLRGSDGGEFKLLDGASLTINMDLRVDFNAAADAKCRYTQSGGDAIITRNVYIGWGYCNDNVLTISGGTFTQSDSGYLFEIARYSSGTFEVIGDDSTITIAAPYEQYSAGILKTVIDGDGITTITVNNTANFNKDDGIGGTLTVVDDGADPGTYILMTYTSCSGTFGTVNKPAGGLWDDPVYGTTALTITKVPEPATMVLLGLGGIGVLIRRKRR